jgi:enoyl-CoA hydratase
VGAAEEIVLARADGVATLTLNAPQRRNALTTEMAAALVDACEAIDADPSVGAVVVQGAGGYFCAGGDRATLAAAGEDPAEPGTYAGMGLIYRSFARVGELEPPTVAAVRGGAVGAGMNLVLATDLRVVAREARLASGFLPIGLHPGGGHGILLGRAGSREAAAGLALFGQPVDGARAVELGLAWEAAPDEDVEARARELAAVPAADPELARRTARSLRAELGPPALPWAAALELERAGQMWSMRRRFLAG